MTRSPATGGIGSVRLEHPAGGLAEVYLQGAQVGTWTRPDGEGVLFVSRERRLEPGVPLRGGIPVIFPQFARLGPLPQHAFVRTLPWDLVEQGIDGTGAARALLRRVDDAGTRAVWPHRFALELAIVLDDALTTTLRVSNPDDRPFAFRPCLHTYLRVGDVREVRVHGLAGARYPVDPTQPTEWRVEGEGPLGFGGEFDRVYVGAPAQIGVEDRSLGRWIVVEKRGFEDAVVWSPGPEWAREAPDLAEDEVRGMLCVEPASIHPPVHLEPGGSWMGVQRVRVARDGGL